MILPTVPARGSAEPPEFRPSPLEVQRRSLLDEPPSWEIVHDALTRRASRRFVERSTERIDASTVVSHEYRLVSEADADDPATASARGRHISTIRRPAGVTEAISEVTMQGTATHFHVTLELRVTVNGLPHHSREWTRSVPRSLL